MSDLPLPVDLIDPSTLTPALLAALQAGDTLLSIKALPAGRGGAHGGQGSGHDSARYEWVNEAMRAFIGVEAEHLLGRTDAELLLAGDAAAWHAADQRAFDARGAVVDTHRFERQGQRIVLNAWRLPIGVPGSTQATWLLTALRIDTQQALQAQLQQALAQIERQQAQMERQLREQAQGQDRPTELFRREHFDEHLRREVALCQREEREFTLVLMAIEQMAVLQQCHGVAAMQRVADAMGQLMRQNTRAMDVLAQLDADRFAILFSGVGLATAHARAEQLRRACATELLVQNGESFGFVITAGVASFPHSADSLIGISEAAQRALSDAQARGGNQVALASIRLVPPPR